MGDIISSEVNGELTVKEGVVVAGETKTSGVNMKAHRLHSIGIPSGFTPGNITFEGSFDGSSYFPIHNSSGLYTIANAAAGTIYVVDFATFFGFQYVKAVVATPPNADRSITFGGVPR